MDRWGGCSIHTIRWLWNDIPKDTDNKGIDLYMVHINTTTSSSFYDMRKKPGKVLGKLLHTYYMFKVCATWNNFRTCDVTGGWIM